jgi:hypothetical protein
MALPDIRVRLTRLSAISTEALYEKCAPAVFSIEVFDANGKGVKTGSGFFITGSGVAATNYHVLSGGTAARVKTSDGVEYEIIGVYDFDKQMDIALIQIEGADFTALELGKSGDVRTGDLVYTIGNPLGLYGSLAKGVVSSALRSVDGSDYIQIDAPISSGSSGGALIDAYGRAIGITSASYQGGQNLNFAVPIDALETLNMEETSTLGSLLPDTAYYDGFFPTPDFGAYAGVPLSSRYTDDEATYFRYATDASPDDVDALLDGYGELLEQNFFEYYGYFSSADRSKQAYINGSYGIFAVYGAETIDGGDYIVVTLLELL